MKNEEGYLNIWRKVHSSSKKNEHKNILTFIIKILLITSITNAKLEWMVSCMLRVKGGWTNRLANVSLDHNLKVREKGVSISDDDPNDAIAKWYNEKEKKENEKQYKWSDGNSVVNIAAYVLFDLRTMMIMMIRRRKQEHELKPTNCQSCIYIFSYF